MIVYAFKLRTDPWFLEPKWQQPKRLRALPRPSLPPTHASFRDIHTSTLCSSKDKRHNVSTSLHSTVSSEHRMTCMKSFATWCFAQRAMFVFHRKRRSMSPWYSCLSKDRINKSITGATKVASSKRRSAHFGTHASLSAASSKCAVGSRDGDADAPCWLIGPG